MPFWKDISALLVCDTRSFIEPSLFLAEYQLLVSGRGSPGAGTSSNKPPGPIVVLNDDRFPALWVDLRDHLGTSSPRALPQN